MHLLFILQTAFSLWMLIDAIKRRAPEYWWIIILVPFGEWAYFFAVKLPDMQFTSTLKKQLFGKRISLEQLRQEFSQTPSHENEVRLAQALHDHGHYEEATKHFEAVLRSNEDDKESLHGYALCCLHMNNKTMAIRALERLVDMDMHYADHDPCFTLAELHDKDGQRTKAISLLEKTCKTSQRIGPRVMLAQYLAADGRTNEAAETLKQGLISYSASPGYVKHRDRIHARTAKSLLRKLLA